MINTLELTVENGFPFVSHIWVAYGAPLGSPLGCRSSAKIVNDYHCPRQLQGYFALRLELHRKALREGRERHLPRYKTAMGQSTFEYAAAKEWNDLPKTMHACETLRCFKVKTFKFFIELDKTQHMCSV